MPSASAPRCILGREHGGHWEKKDKEKNPLVAKKKKKRKERWFLGWFFFNTTRSDERRSMGRGEPNHSAPRLGNGTELPHARSQPTPLVLPPTTVGVFSATPCAALSFFNVYFLISFPFAILKNRRPCQISC